MDVYSVTSHTAVVDDENSSMYNTIHEDSEIPNSVSRDYIGHSLTDGTTYAMIYIEHNGSGFSSSGVVSGNGSAIGLRGQFGSLSPTYGDVDISYDDMVDLLDRLDYYKNPKIEIKVK
jgi:L,D-peptidoglycan transpeptidase YkuD (ErfK/YbiS/YcfS/YnhG family)